MSASYSAELLGLFGVIYAWFSGRCFSVGASEKWIGICPSSCINKINTYFFPLPGRSAEVFRAGCVGGAKALTKNNAVLLCWNPGLGCRAAVAWRHIRVTPPGSQRPLWAGLAIGTSFISEKWDWRQQGCCFSEESVLQYWSEIFPCWNENISCFDSLCNFKMAFQQL